MAKNKVRLMLDSGAFSGWTLGRPINVKDYIAWVWERQELIATIIGLDVIPGRFGHKRTQKDVDEAAAASYKNLQAMKDKGIPAIPVFHRGESLTWLERYIKDGEPYIGISPLVDSAESVKQTWLDQVFSLITDSKGWATVKTHGFGVTNPALMMRYPWYSVDSTSWVKGGGFGKMNIPVFENGKPNYLKPPVILHASDVSRGRAGPTLIGLGQNSAALVLKYLEDHGFTLSEMMISRRRRCQAMLAYYNEFEKHLPLPFRHRRISFSGAQPFKMKAAHAKKALEGGLNKKFYLYHSTNMSGDQASTLSEMGAFNRLLSYFELRECPDSKIEEYIRYGVEQSYERKPPPPRWEGRRYTSFRRMQLLKRFEDGTQGPVGED